VGIDTPGHGLGLRVWAVCHARQVPPQFLYQRDELGHLLFYQEVHMEVEEVPLLFVLALTVLRDEDHGGHEESKEAHDALQPVERRGVEGSPQGVETNPTRHEGEDGEECCGSSHRVGEPLDDPLRLTSTLLGSGV
jgi:hypothetical protein